MAGNNLQSIAASPRDEQHWRSILFTLQTWTTRSRHTELLKATLEEAGVCVSDRQLGVCRSRWIEDTSLVTGHLINLVQNISSNLQSNFISSFKSPPNEAAPPPSQSSVSCGNVSNVVN